MIKQPSGPRFRLTPLNRRKGVYAFSALIPAAALGAFALWPGQPAGEPEVSAEIVAAAPELRPAMDAASPTVETEKGERPVLDMETTAALEAAVAAPLSDDDPRWGSPRPAPASSSVDTTENEPLQNQLVARAATNRDAGPFAAMKAGADAQPLDQGSAVDIGTTASISPDSLPPVEVAEDEAEIAMLEASVAERQETVPDAAFVVEAEEPSANLFAATTTAYVNFREGPSNDAPTIEILPGGEAIEASKECPHFCEARHDGRDGYIYKSYIAFPGEERAAPEPEPEAAEQAAAAPAPSPEPSTPAAAPAEEKRNITFFDLLNRDQPAAGEENP